MKETPAAHRRRTGRPYDPPAVGRALEPDEPCPTLYRYPGPAGLRDHLDGRLSRLAPASTPWVHLSTRPTASRPGSTRAFGVLAVVDPLALDPVAAGRGVYLARNRPASGRVVWVPPSAIGRAGIPWSDLGDADEAARHLGDATGEADRTRRALRTYLEELALLAAAGARNPGRPWAEIPRADRRRLLDRHRIAGPWSGA